MTYKDILVYADASPAAAARLDVAALLATAFEAHLVALHVDTRPYTPADVLGTGIGASVLQWQKQVRQERAEAAERLVKDAAQRNGIAFEWRRVEGEIGATILDHGRYHDLIVLSQDGSLTDLDAPIEPFAGSIVVSAGRPVVVVPRQYKARSCGKRVLVAWKPTAEAARAVHDALPVLQKADAVTVMRINPDPEEPAHNPGFDLAAHLARHGVKVTVTPILAADMDAGSLIASCASELEADLIVMGAYGHSRLRELVFGGATRHMLGAPVVPVLMSR
ncbi:MAG: universal stress protein [Ferrovibrio sp.]|uniref:universal stress protein n=1 Tax=Ferrovibrio sp. TaxID=1917215 RepID=UPI00261168D5|nr:universal stress protein [Ferrovibrio sp.]MCW0233020.1 universal stress protein [Ferrovibrio sp.]